MLPKDPVMLLSFVNTKLRDYYSNIDIFCEEEDVERQDILDRLSSINYVYSQKDNQFIRKGEN